MQPAASAGRIVMMTSPTIAEPAAIRALEQRAFRAWPALETATYCGWVLRYAEGFTKRANCANAVTPSAPFGMIRPIVEMFFRKHHQPAIFRLTPLAEDLVDRALEDAGYILADPTLVMVARLPEARPADAGVVIETIASPRWRAGHAAATSVSETARAVHERLLAAIEMPAAYAALVENGKPVAYGLAVFDRGMVGLFDIVVAPGARRRGAGRRLTLALMGWGQSLGAAGAYLQVSGTNEAAIALYRLLGFNAAYGYHYRIRPA